MMYLGDFAADEPISFAWNTSGMDGQSITRSIDGTISVYKDNSDGSSFDPTQVTTGVTNDEDFDGLTGVHTCCITTTNAWYEVGHDYMVVLAAATIDTQVVNVVLAHFSIENRYTRGTNSAALAATALTNATWTDAKAVFLDHSINTVDGVADGIQTDLSNAADGLGALKTLIEACYTGTPPTTAQIKTAIEAAGSSLATILADTNELQGDWKNTGRLDNLLDACNTVTPDVAGTLASYDPPTRTEATADKDAIIADLLTMKKKAAGTWNRETDSLEAIRDRGDDAWTTATGFNTTTPPTVTQIRQEMDANSTKMAPSQTIADYKATGFSTHSAANVWAVATRILTANTNFNDLNAAAIKAEVVAALADIKLDHLINIAVDTDWATTVHLNSVIGHIADVGTAATFNRTTDALEALRNRGDDAWTTATGFNTTTPPTVGEIKTEMEGVGSKLLAIEGDTNELQTDWVNGGRLDLILDRLLDVMEIRHGLSVNDPGGAATTTKFITTLTEGAGFPWERAAVLFTSGANSGLMRRIKSYNGTTKEITVHTPIHAAPADNDTFVMPTVRAFITPDIEDIVDQVCDELTSEHTTNGSLAKAVSDTLSDTNDLQTNQVNWITATGFSVPDEYDAVLTAIKGATFDTASDSLEAIRNRGDDAWVTGGAAPTVEEIRNEIDDNSTKLASIRSIASFIRAKLL